MNTNEIAESEAGKAISSLKEKLAFVASHLTDSDWSIIRNSIKVAVRDGVNHAKQDAKGQQSQGSYGGPLEKGKPYYSGSDPFPFGKHGPKGNDPKSFDEMPSGYLNWLMGQDWIEEWPGIVRYVNGETEDNLPPLRDDEKVHGASSEIPF